MLRVIAARAVLHHKIQRFGCSQDRHLAHATNPTQPGSRILQNPDPPRALTIERLPPNRRRPPFAPQRSDGLGCNSLAAEWFHGSVQSSGFPLPARYESRASPGVNDTGLKIRRNCGRRAVVSVPVGGPAANVAGADLSIGSQQMRTPTVRIKGLGSRQSSQEALCQVPGGRDAARLHGTIAEKYPDQRSKHEAQST